VASRSDGPAIAVVHACSIVAAGGPGVAGVVTSRAMGVGFTRDMTKDRKRVIIKTSTANIGAQREDFRLGPRHASCVTSQNGKRKTKNEKRLEPFQSIPYLVKTGLKTGQPIYSLDLGNRV
jgi:hypothetical protein